MKFLNVLFTSVMFFSLAQCNPFALDDDRRIRDEAEGERDYKIKDIKELNEIAKRSILDDCSQYNKGFSMSLFGSKSPTKALQNCINYALDNGLKPICEQEEDLKELLEYYEKKREHDKVEEIEEQLLITEDIKYGLADDIYAMADQFDEMQEVATDGIDDWVEEQTKKRKKYEGAFEFAGILGKFGAGFELGSFTRLLDIRANRVCSSIDYSRIGRFRR